MPLWGMPLSGMPLSGMPLSGMPLSGMPLSRMPSGRFGGSPRHQNRELRLHDDVPGAATEDHLADAALRVSALQQEIGTSRHRFLQKRLALRLLPAIGRPD